MHPPAKSSPIPPRAGRTSSEDVWGVEGVFVSWLQWQSGPDVPGNRARVLLPDVLWSELNVDQRSLNLSMPHELHQSWQTNTRAEHVRSEGVAAMLHEA